MNKKLMNEVIFSFEELIQRVPEQKDIILYGAGTVAKMLGWCLKKVGRPAKLYLVTKMNASNLEEIDSVPIISVDNIHWEKENAVYIIATKRRIPQIEMLDVLINKKVADIILMNNNLEDSIREYYFVNLLQEKQPGYKLVMNLENEPNHYTIGCGDEYQYQWRIHKENSLPIKSFADLWDNDLLTLFEKQYGKYLLLRDMKLNNHINSKREYIYAAKSNVDKELFSESKSDIIRYVQAGAIFTENNICELRDDIGENISIKNKNFSECTVLYWVWKNIEDAEYIGFCHYRRMFDFPSESLGCLEGTQIDIVLTIPTLCDQTIRNYFVHRYISCNDWKILMDGIKNYSEDYYQIALIYENSHFFSPCNMLIMRRDVLNEYCSFAFEIAGYIEAQYQHMGVQRQDRYMGYIFENLLAIFVMYHKDDYCIAYTDMKYLN